MLCACSLSGNMPSSGNKIFWNEHQLSWDDFKGRADRGTKYKAQTYSVINFRSEYQGDQVILMVDCWFEKKRSWVKKDSKKDYLLNHEQKHFDLTEVYARKLRSEFSKLDQKSRTQKKLLSLFKKITKQSSQRQKDYDKDTNHSINTEAQEHWNGVISAELKEFEAFK